jgi:DNA-binding protein HU-beta
MTKQQLVNRISQRTGIASDVGLLILETFFEVVKTSVSQQETIYLRTFGSFGPKQRARKVARRIKENTTMIIEAHAIPSFKPSAEFVEQVKTSDHLKQ